MDAVRQAYEAAKLPRRPDKGFELEPRSDFWGISFDAVKGVVKGAPSRVAPLASLTCKVVSLGICAVGLLQAIAGGWVSVMRLHRRCLSILDRVYAAQLGREQNHVSLCVILAPLMQANLRLRHDTRVQATDASNWGEAESRLLCVKAQFESCVASAHQRQRGPGSCPAA